MITLEKKALKKNALKRSVWKNSRKTWKSFGRAKLWRKNGEKLPIKKVWLAGKVDPQLFKIIIHTNRYVCSDPMETSFYFKIFSQMDERVDVNKENSAGEKDDAADFDEDKEDHNNFIELSEEYGKNWREKNQGTKKGSC